MNEFNKGFIGSIVGGFLFLGIAYLAIGIEDLNYLKDQKRLLENNVRFSKAITLGNAVFRCNKVLLNEGLKND